MSPLAIACIGAVIVLILMALRMPIFFAFAIVGFIGVWYFKGLESAFNAVATIPYATLDQYIWSVIPMFIFMGYLAMHTKMAEEFYAGVRKWIGQFRGGLAASIIAGNTAFGAVSGDTLAAAVTFSVISLPETRKYGYADSLTLGSVAAGGILSILIPPSIGFILYGGITQTSIGKLFIGGILPGLLLAVLYIGTIIILCLRNPGLGPPGPRTTWREKIGATPGMWVLVTVFVVMIGGLYMGLFTPTEAGAVVAFLVLVLGVTRRRLSWQDFIAAIARTGLTTGMILFLLVGVKIFNLFLVMTGLPFSIVELVTGISQSPTVILLLITAIYLFLGMFIDAPALILLTIPFLFPVVESVGCDPITFGVVATLASTIGTVTPPFGMIVYAMATIVKDVPMFTIFRGVAPFLIPMIICLLLVIFFPQIATWLPSMMPH